MPIKVDGFSVGAVMGFTQHNTVICLATDKDIQAFTAVRAQTLQRPQDDLLCVSK